MKKFNSIISILLATVLLLTMIPMTVIAEGDSAVTLPAGVSFTTAPSVVSDGDFGEAWNITNNAVGELKVNPEAGKTYKLTYDVRVASGGTGIITYTDGWGSFDPIPGFTWEPDWLLKYPGSTSTEQRPDFTQYVTVEYTFDTTDNSTKIVLKYKASGDVFYSGETEGVADPLMPRLIQIRSFPDGNVFFKNVSFEEVKRPDPATILPEGLSFMYGEPAKVTDGDFGEAWNTNGTADIRIPVEAGKIYKFSYQVRVPVGGTCFIPNTSAYAGATPAFTWEESWVLKYPGQELTGESSDFINNYVTVDYTFDTLDGSTKLDMKYANGNTLYSGESEAVENVVIPEFIQILSIGGEGKNIFFKNVSFEEVKRPDLATILPEGLSFMYGEPDKVTDGDFGEAWNTNGTADIRIPVEAGKIYKFSYQVRVPVGGTCFIPNTSAYAGATPAFTWEESWVLKYPGQELTGESPDFINNYVTVDYTFDTSDGRTKVEMKYASGSVFYSGETEAVENVVIPEFIQILSIGGEGKNIFFKNVSFEEVDSFVEPEVLLDLNFEEGDTQLGYIQDVYSLTNDEVAVDAEGSRALKVVQGSSNDQQFAFVFGTPVSSGKVLISMDYRFENHSSWFHSFAGLYASNGSFWDGGALKYNETFRNQLFIDGVGKQKGAGVLGQNGNDSYNNLKMLVDLDNDILRVYHDGVGAVWYDADEKSYTEYSIDNQENLGKLLFKYGTNADSGFHGEDSENPENSVYWFDNIKAVTVPKIQYIGGTYENGSENLALTQSLNEEFNFTEDISAEYFDENGKLLPENANLFILKKNGAVLDALEYSVSLIDGKKLVVDSEVKPGDSFEFTMKKEVKVSGLEQLKEDFVHSVTFDSAPVSVTLTTAEGETDELKAGIETTVTAELNVKEYTVIVATYEKETLLKSITMFNEGEDISVKITPDENTILKIFIMHDDNILTPFVNAIVK